VARRKLTDTSHPDTTLTDSYWLTWGDEPQPHMRQKIIYLTFEEVSKIGPGAFGVSNVCDRLGITYPMVNHYFGGRDQLLAEGAYHAYIRYVTSLWEAVDAAPRNPVARLEAWMRAQISWTRQWSGWGALLNYPVASLMVTEILDRNFRDDMQRYFEWNLAGLAVLVNDVLTGTVTEERPSLDNSDRTDLLSNIELVHLTSSVAFSTLGASVWNAGQHLPSAKIQMAVDMAPELVEQHIQRVIRMLQNKF
jgi:AcrR family transcriptional regulator